MVKYGAVIGWKTRAFACAQSECSGDVVDSANHGTAIHPVHHITEFRQMTSVNDSASVDPSHKSDRFSHCSFLLVVLLLVGGVQPL
jgi:hypothetical protein